jgi:hypothetical protein
MRGKSLLIATAVGSLVLAACKATISQKANSGKDYRYKGAKTIKLDDDGEGRSKRDVVTYPGGDREDWKVFEVPEGARGELEVRIKHRPPRPDLDVAFNVYDEYFERVGRAKPKPGDRTKKVTIEDARAGKYYVQVYAPRRIDAGKYRVRVRFKPKAIAGKDPEPGPEAFPDPPKLPAVPEPVEKVPCPDDPTKFQPDCPGPKVPCPNDPTKFEPDCPVEVVKSISCRIRNYKISASSGTVVICDKGTKHGVAKGWKGQLMTRSGSPLPGGTFTVTRVTSRESTGKVRLTVDQVKSSGRVLLSPP